MSRPTGPTTVLDRQTTIGRTRELGRTKQNKAWVLTSAAIFIVAIAVSAYFYLSRTNNAAINSIAVLPFQNASGDPNMEYLSDGIAEGLMNSLSQLPNLKVMSRNTAFRYKGKEQDAEEVGKELNVRAVLTGSLKQMGDHIVISVSLDDARDVSTSGAHSMIVRPRISCPCSEEIARDITGNLRLRLTGEEQKRLIKDQTENTEAYLLYLKGRYHTARYTKEDLNKGLDYFRQAIAIDPRYAQAYDGLAYYYMTAADWFMPAKEAMPKAGDAARKALELDDTLAQAHASLAIFHWWFDWDWSAAETEFKRAIELNPQDVRAHEFFGWYLIS
jgi:serine/threonine-protein kinase